MQKTIKTLLSIAGVILLAVIALQLRSTTPNSLGYDPGQITYRSMTNASSSVATTSAVVVSANSARVYLSIVNDGSSVVYINAATTSVAGVGIRLNSNGGTYFMDAAQNGTYTGAWSAITSSGTSTLTILEK